MKKLVLVAIVLIALLLSASLCFAQTTLIFATPGQRTLGLGEQQIGQFNTSLYNSIRIYIYCKATFNLSLKAVENNVTEWLLDVIACTPGHSITRQYQTPARTIRLVTFMSSGTGSLSVLVFGSN